MFKKRAIEKKVDLNKDIESIQVDQHQQNDNTGLGLPKSMHSKKINKFTTIRGHLEHQKNEKNQKRPLIKPIQQYGLLPQQQPQPQEHQEETNNSKIIQLYIKKKMESMASLNAKKSAISTNNEIIQMQKKYLEAPQTKIAEFDLKELLKKFQKNANEAIRNQLQARSNYLKNLLESQHERLQYASKKELKVMRQEKQREEKELISKYKTDGRRFFVSKAKNDTLLN